jgi:hypothetical protein
MIKELMRNYTYFDGGDDDNDVDNDDDDDNDDHTVDFAGIPHNHDHSVTIHFNN